MFPLYRGCEISQGGRGSRKRAKTGRGTNRAGDEDKRVERTQWNKTMSGVRWNFGNQKRTIWCVLRMLQLSGLQIYRIDWVEMKKAASKSSHLMSVCQSDIFAANILELQKRGLYFPYYLVVTKRHCRSAVRCPPKTICRRCVALSVGRNDGYFPIWLS